MQKKKPLLVLQFCMHCSCSLISTCSSEIHQVVLSLLMVGSSFMEKENCNKWIEWIEEGLNQKLWRYLIMFFSMIYFAISLFFTVFWYFCQIFFMVLYMLSTLVINVIYYTLAIHWHKQREKVTTEHENRKISENITESSRPWWWQKLMIK